MYGKRSLAEERGYHGWGRPIVTMVPGETKDMNPERIPGISRLRYVGPSWSVNVTNPVVLHPTYTIMIDCTVEEGFYWEGTVDPDGNVHELHYARWHLISPTEL